ASRVNGHVSHVSIEAPLMSTEVEPSSMMLHHYHAPFRFYGLRSPARTRIQTTPLTSKRILERIREAVHSPTVSLQPSPPRAFVSTRSRQVKSTRDPSFLISPIFS
ncbi:MAG: hypothetical protein AB7T06_26745, partial [Kofleriaceae bacterium]